MPITLFGPHFGIMLLKRFVQPVAGSPGGYYDQPFLIAHNTFIFGKWGINDPSDPIGGGATWYFKARRPSAAIIDVTDPGCTPGPTDSDNNLRGVGRAGILGNLFRTIGDSFHHPMLGIEDVDTVFTVGGPGGAPVQTNAFDSLLAARTFAAGAFYSTPVAATAQYSGACGTLWNDNANPPTVGCLPPSQAAAPSTFPANPPVEIWHGPTASPNLGTDPAFVGEYLEVTYGGAMVYHSDDWRLLPGSPCEDKGYPLTSGTPLPRLVYTLAGEVFDSAPLPELALFNKWDGEHWGNPRWIDSQYATAPGNGTDIGFDETHLMIMCGSWANLSNSHHTNRTPDIAFLSPHVPDAPDVRHMIFPTIAGGSTSGGMVLQQLAGMQITVYPKNEAPANPPPKVHGWINPPQSLASPGVNGQLPFGYRTKYILFDATGDAGLPAPWAFVLDTATHLKSYRPVHGNTLSANQSTLSFFDVALVDDECNVPQPAPTSCYHFYFNTQAVAQEGGFEGPILLRGNMQAEFR